MNTDVMHFTAIRNDLPLETDVAIRKNDLGMSKV